MRTSTVRDTDETDIVILGFREMLLYEEPGLFKIANKPDKTLLTGLVLLNHWLMKSLSDNR